MAVGKGKRVEKGAAEVEKGGEMVAMAAGKGEKGSAVAEEGEKGSVVLVEKGEDGSVVAEKGKGVAEEVAGGDTITPKSSDGKPFEVSEEASAVDMMITLKSSDGKPFEVSKAAAARLSTFVAEKIKGGCSEGGIKLGSIASEPLERVVDYCNKHGRANSDTSAAASSSSSFNTGPSSKELEEWDRELVGRLSQDALFDLTEAAHFLGMDGLLDVTCRKIADMMRGKNTAQIREIFNIENDFTEEEEEEEIRRENAWAFELL